MAVAKAAELMMDKVTGGKGDGVKAGGTGHRNVGVVTFQSLVGIELLGSSS